jgi:cell division protein FtsB
MKYGNRSIWNKLVASPLSVMVLVVIAFVLARAVFNIYNKAQLSENRLAQAEANLSNLTQRQKDIASKVESLSTDQGIEAEIRTRYHAVKSGELVAVIVDDSQTANVRNAATSTSSATSSLSWWRRWLRVFGL